MEAEIRANLALNQEAMQSWDEKVIGGLMS